MADTYVLDAAAPVAAIISSPSSSSSSFTTSSSPSSSLGSDVAAASDSAHNASVVAIALPFCVRLGSGEREERGEAVFEMGDDGPALVELMANAKPENLTELRR